MEKIYKAIDIAKYVITKCTNDEEYISNLQLQKILYYIQEKFLKSYRKPLFSDEIQAWQFGPVVPSVYAIFCGYGAMTIENEYDVKIDETIRKIIDPIIEIKRKLQPWVLVEETHRPGGAWDKIYGGGRGNREVIPKELIGRL